MNVDRIQWNSRPTTSFMDLLIQFIHQLRANDIGVTLTETLDFIKATSIIGITNRTDFKHAAKTTLITSRDSLPVFDEVFETFWSKNIFEQIQLSNRSLYRLNSCEDGHGSGLESDDLIKDIEQETGLASNQQIARRKDLAKLSESELQVVKDELEKIVHSLRYKAGRRRQARRRGREIDFRKFIQRNALQVRPQNILYKQRKLNRSKLFVLCDISGSMASYSQFFLHLLYALERAFDESSLAVFATNAYDVSHCVHKRDLEDSVRELSMQTNEWGGGTNIGQSINTFMNLFGSRMNRRNTIVVIMSDGLDTGEPQLLNEGMARLNLCCKKIIWLNPHLARPGFEPLTRGMQTSLPYIDDFLPANSLSSLKNAVINITNHHSLH